MGMKGSLASLVWYLSNKWLYNKCHGGFVTKLRFLEIQEMSVCVVPVKVIPISRHKPSL